MVATEGPHSMHSLVDVEKGLISRDIFVSDEIYQQELEQIFARTWLFIGHTSQIPNPNDFFISRMGEESVIMTRDRQGEVHVLLNTCRHRGMKVIRYDRGNTPVFTCPYHGWSYSTDGNLVSVPGELIGVPQFATAYHGELEKEEWGLISVPKMHVYKGSVWACWDKDAPEWDEYMGGMIPYLDVLLESIDGDPDGRIVMPGVQKWVAPHNWKFGPENFIGDEYHGVPTHRSAMLGGFSSTRKDNDKYIPGVAFKEQMPLISISFPQGHGVIRSLPPEEWHSTESLVIDDHHEPKIDRYFKDAYAKRIKRWNGFGPQQSGGVPSTVFPNLSFGGGPTSFTIVVWHPTGPRTTESWRWYFYDRSAPPEVRRAWRDDTLPVQGPTGQVETDDEENWVYATSASRGTIARRYPYNYQMGLGRARADSAFPRAKINDIPPAPWLKYRCNEENQRGFYSRWSVLMEGKKWDEIRQSES